MFDHIGIQVTDPAASAAVYLAALAPLGIVEHARFPAPEGEVVGIGPEGGHPGFWLSAGVATTPRHEAHVAFVAPSRDAVAAVHEAVLAAGLEVLHAPRVFPEYHPHYFGVFFRDLDGNNVEAVCHVPATQPETPMA